MLREKEASECYLYRSKLKHPLALRDVSEYTLPNTSQQAGLNRST